MSQACAAFGLQVSGMPHGWIDPGLHTPVHCPCVQTKGHGAPVCHCPLWSQVCGVMPMHCAIPGTQLPVHAPVTHAAGHCKISIHTPSLVQRKTLRPRHSVEFGTQPASRSALPSWIVPSGPGGVASESPTELSRVTEPAEPSSVEASRM